MRVEFIRARGQAALFAGVWLVLVVPFFRFGALQTTGYDQASLNSFQAKNYAPLLEWGSQHLAVIVVFSLIQALPYFFMLSLPELLRRVVYGEGGQVNRWLGTVGILIIGGLTLVGLVFYFSAASRYGGLSPADRGSLGADYRVISITESLIANVFGRLLLAFWLVGVNMSLARVPGLERGTGMLGIGSAGLFLAAAALSAFDPQAPLSVVSGTATAIFGIWLAVVGVMLIRRSPMLAEPTVSDASAVGTPESPPV